MILSVAPSPWGEGWGEGAQALEKAPHPDPLPKEREKNVGAEINMTMH
jgi:hypothetical protein